MSSRVRTLALLAVAACTATEPPPPPAPAPAPSLPPAQHCETAGTLTIYAIPPPIALDWSTPNNLLSSVIASRSAAAQLVDAGDARLSMWLNGKKVDEMKIVVGKAESPTPMMAAYIKYADVNPYWNVPPDLVKNLIGPRIVAQGVGYLTEREYQVMTDYSEDAKLIDPNDVDWKAVVAGTQNVRLRRLPSPANSMGMMKFMLPNYFGIYLHDSPEKEHFTKNELWISNGCVRLEDYKRLAKFLFDGIVPQGKNPKVEQHVDLPAPIPVYMTYLTVQPTADGVQFLEDHYGRDAHLMERYGPQLLAAVHGQ